jgi:hypothetical protein
MIGLPHCYDKYITHIPSSVGWLMAVLMLEVLFMELSLCSMSSRQMGHFLCLGVFSMKCEMHH